MALTADQIALVKSTAPVIKEHGKTITTTFYQRLLSAHPELKNYFSLRNQQSGAQQAALADAVFAYAAFIDDLPRLAGAVDRIAHKHASLFVRPEHYPVVGEFLVAAFAEVLGDALTSDVAEAWVAAYAQLADVFVRRERQLYDETAEWQDWRAFAIVRKEHEADDILSLYLEPRDGRPLRRYLPGQYVSVRIPIPELGGLFQCRQFSLSTAPDEGMRQYRVSVKREQTVDNASVQDLADGKVPGLISNKLHREYAEGAEVELSPPRGEFFFDVAAAGPAAPVVLLSVGVGATPLLSILESIVGSATQALRPVSWVHAARRPGAVCFAKPVGEIASRHANVRSLVFVKHADKQAHRPGRDYDLEGRLSMEKAEAEGLLHLQDRSAGYYICGPEEWMVQARKWLQDRGVARERVFVELFSTGEVH
ncbi:globin domain-containing protein [Hirsutella rhossiliensis]|uniref:nitric oxide dioxygenase n=1 Tax=Hirsutella rhossiliensis TaxID=111463 RepID=A0A9P8MT69_9HYPO|nr:globin domain-containing protein [Hirsutella rhossiliensis]KAH0961708.1 globin domain-containing protein [Hirsutella rhossiliensis]